MEWNYGWKKFKFWNVLLFGHFVSKMVVHVVTSYITQCNFLPEIFLGNIKQINSCPKSVWYALRQHSYNTCNDFLSNNSWMKNLNFTNSCNINMNWNIYTIFIQLKTTFFEKSVKTINSNNSTKFEVNWRRRGSQFTARHTKNRQQFDE